MATVWALPYRPNCAALAWDDDPAIARVGGECIRLSDYANKLYVVEAGIEYAERELLPDDPYFDTWWERHQRVISYGPETVALADAIRDSALYQRAVEEGHAPTDEEVAVRADLDRRHTEGSRDFLELARLANKSDLAGFRKVLERSRHPDLELEAVSEDTSLRGFMASLQEWEDSDLRELEKSSQEWEAYLESVGRERYWNKIHPAELRRDLSIIKLNQAVMDASIDGPWEIPGMAWLHYREETLSRISAELTEAAPPNANLDSALSYLAELLEAERRSLAEEYRRFMERRGERRRLTPSPPRYIGD